MEVIIIMGSEKDMEHSKRIAKLFEEFEVPYKLKVASAHKTPLKVLEILKEYEDKDAIFITVAGKSDALSGFVSANTEKPVIACPPFDEKKWFDIFSTIRMPIGATPMLVLEPENAAIAALKIIGIKNERIRGKIKEYLNKLKENI
uniref:N5-carboxyaminoimidazole ribonucleotide mutase n=1 Tax=candidate division WOR-3 bacterium TaxID=2052148 RepID=A0A7V3ZT38_UNCW3